MISTSRHKGSLIKILSEDQLFPTYLFFEKQNICENFDGTSLHKFKYFLKIFSSEEFKTGIFILVIFKKFQGISCTNFSLIKLFFSFFCELSANFQRQNIFQPLKHNFSISACLAHLINFSNILKKNEIRKWQRKIEQKFCTCSSKCVEQTSHFLNKIF